MTQAKQAQFDSDCGPPEPKVSLRKLSLVQFSKRNGLHKAKQTKVMG